jgi:hypothetical protein
LTHYAETSYIAYANGEEIMSANIKEEARRLVENLPEDVTWDDLMYQIYVRQNIEAGLADSEADRVTDVEKVREEFGLPA